jgi:hypothetical protein
MIGCRNFSYKGAARKFIIRIHEYPLCTGIQSQCIPLFTIRSVFVRNRVPVIAVMLGCGHVDPGFDSTQGQHFFSPPNRSHRLWGPPSLQWAPNFFMGLSWPGHESTIHLYLLPRLTMSGAVTLLPQDTSAWFSAFLVSPKSCRISQLSHLPHPFSVTLRPDSGPWPSLTGLRDHTQNTPHSAGHLWTNDQSDAETSTWQQTTLTRDKQPCPRRDLNHSPSKRTTANSRLRPRDQWDRRLWYFPRFNYPSSIKWRVCLYEMMTLLFVQCYPSLC